MKKLECYLGQVVDEGKSVIVGVVDPLYWVKKYSQRHVEPYLDEWDKLYPDWKQYPLLLIEPSVQGIKDALAKKTGVESETIPDAIIQYALDMGPNVGGALPYYAVFDFEQEGEDSGEAKVDS